MTLVLHTPAATGRNLERLNYFPGRSLGEEEFDLRQRYVEARLQPLVGTVRPGIVSGLNAKVDRDGDAGTAVTVLPGLGIAGNGRIVGLYRAVTQPWRELVRDLRDAEPGRSVRGIYYLIVGRTDEIADRSQDIDPCRRFDLDPHRDTRFETVGRLSLRRLLLVDADIDNRIRFENLVAAMHVDGNFLRGISRALPVGLVAIDGNGRVRWFSEVAGRYLAEPDAGYQVLLKQTIAAFQRAVAVAPVAPGDEAGLVQHLVDTLVLDYLPAAGQLPIELLRNRASAQPSMAWLPGHIRADMIPVAQDEVAEIVARHLARRVIDVRQAAAGEHLRLLLAVNNQHYRRDLLDIPAPDQSLETQFFRNYMRAHNAWRAWLRRFRGLYYLPTNVPLDPSSIAALDLPEEIDPPLSPNKFYGNLISTAARRLGDPNVNPYRRGPPRGPDFYQIWLDAGIQADTPNRPGLVVRFQIESVELERLDNRIRALRSRVEKTRDFLLLQRQQLDSQTVSLSALAGGVAGDGAGLQVARWLPFTELKPPEKPTEETPPPETSPTPAPFTLNAIGTARLAGVRFESSREEIVPKPAPAAPSREASSVFTPAAMQFSLQARPQQLSALDFGLNRFRLDKLAEAPRRAVTNPSFSTNVKAFGVLDHIRPELHEYKAAYRGMLDLLTTLDELFARNEAASLRNALRKLGMPEPPDKIVGDEGDDARVTAHYQALFTAGKYLTKWIAFCEDRYGKLEALLEDYLRQRIMKEALLEKLRALIRVASDRVALYDRKRLEALGDYGLAQRLVDDDWRDVYQRDQERTRVLNDEVRGLFYVRVRNTPVSEALADPLELRFGSEGDIVPGCDGDEDAEIPDELDQFFDAVLEVPMDDWRMLRPLKKLLPKKPRLRYAWSLRSARFEHRVRANKIGQKPKSVRARLLPVQQSNDVVLQALSKVRLVENESSLKRYNEQAARVFSLEDLLGIAQGHLRREAQKQRDRLELAVACMLEQLDQIPPGVRLQWAEAAEDDRLQVASVELWPGLNAAQHAGFNATRTLAELIIWWFGQVVDDESPESRAAMRNMIRAVLLHAALGDPSDIVQGQVRVPPRVFDIGAAVRLKLNRAVNPGTLLHILDERQKVVGLLNVEDHDDDGTLANVVRADDVNLEITQRFSVAATKRIQVTKR